MKKHHPYLHLKFFIFVLVLMAGKNGFGQFAGINPYLPASFQKEGWKLKAEFYGDQFAASSTFSGAFIKQVNRSGNLSTELIDAQIENFNGLSTLASQQHLGGGIWINNKPHKRKLFYYFGFEHQYLLNASFDDDLLKVLLKGNKAFAGQTLDFADSRYSSIYFNQLKGGIGFVTGPGTVKHTFIGKYAINAGQNYNTLQIQNSSLYTHPDGDYLDILLQASTRLSDTVWAEFYQINGLGFSADLFYSLSKAKDYYFSVDVRNLGFINWNQHTYSATVDTAFVFEGSLNDSLSAGHNLPNGFSTNGLLDFVFSENESIAFSKPLPVYLGFSGGKYFSDGKFYTGIQGKFYSLSQTAYSVECFATWNHNDLLAVTPIMQYNNFSGVDFGLALSARLSDHFLILAGASGLGSLINDKALAGSSGFMRLIISR